MKGEGGARVPLQKASLAAGPLPLPRPPLPGPLGRKVRLVQLGLAVVALATMLFANNGIFASFLVPVAALQCAWSAVAAIVNADWNQLRRTRVFSWTLLAYLVLDMVTFFVTFMAASGAAGIGYTMAVEFCAAEPVRCPVVKRAWPRAVLAWAALQPAQFYFAVIEFWAHAAYSG